MFLNIKLTETAIVMHIVLWCSTSNTLSFLIYNSKQNLIL